MSNQLTSIDFHGQTLLATIQDNVVYTALKPICENIGLSWNAQFERIKRDEVLAEGIRMIRTPTKGGFQDVVCLPLTLLNGWLFGVDTNRVKAEVKETLITYKKECYQALHDYWNNGIAVNPRLTSADTLPLRNAINMATGILKLDYATIYKMVHQRFGITDHKGSKIKILTKEQIGQAVEYVHSLILSAPKQDELDLANILNSETKRFAEHYNRMTWLARCADGVSDKTFFDNRDDGEHIAGLFVKNLLTQYRFEVEFDEGHHDNGSLKLKPISKQAFYSDLPSLPNVLQQQINSKLAYRSKLSETDVDTLCQVIDVCRLAVKHSL
ncbi:phage antirepressor N-terminal domain-containing protein [Moraxella haemolytica]|uniref:phage antirepressor N-terminal domain-containing protein n=1 Tax=Moraxella haemolytica TaxID=2904119 RepID=UPI002543C110|nr:phage antirepressor N-terminal domain-containing protein [Moraxella sp. ZY171148]WII94991.1 phage antirepressor N-terminal domain-containing protein [Moraxella sp. ZY171148]